MQALHHDFGHFYIQSCDEKPRDKEKYMATQSSAVCHN